MTLDTCELLPHNQVSNRVSYYDIYTIVMGILLMQIVKGKSHESDISCQRLLTLDLQLNC